MPALLVALVLLVVTGGPSLEHVLARTVVVQGSITDSASGRPVSAGGAQVTLSIANGATTLASAQTSGDGSYSARISVPDSATTVTVRVRAIGYQPAVRSVRITGDTLTQHFRLTAALLKLDELVVTASAEASRRAQVGAAVARIDASGYRGPPAAAAKVFLRGSAAMDARNTEEYARIEDNRFLSVASSPLSTFSVDVDRASYTNVRRFIQSGTMPPKDAVRIEELINYFPYSYDDPSGRHPVSITTNVAPAPWNPSHRIVHIGLQTQRIRTEKLPPSNLVFLIDVSGSMQPANKLPLVKQAFRLLVNELREQDRVAIVVYAGSAGLVLPSTPASEKQTILDAIERLEAGGSTAGGAGIRLAYDVAKQNFIREGNNRVILATDGDFNVGVSSTSELVRYVEERRADGTALTILGFGMGNLKDGRLEQLAGNANGNYSYIDDLLEARKVFVSEMGATLVTVAKDVKLQVEFNPATVQAYRLIGYENRMLRNEDFTNDKKDAGDMGAGHSVTALYEIVPAGVKLDVEVGTTAPLRYQAPAASRRGRTGESRELLFVNLRYKPPTDSTSRLMQHPVFDGNRAASPELRFALAVAGYGMLLRDSQFKGRLTYDAVLELARDGAGDDRYRTDFLALVESTRRIARGVAKAGSQEDR